MARREHSAKKIKELVEPSTASIVHFSMMKNAGSSGTEKIEYTSNSRNEYADTEFRVHISWQVHEDLFELALLINPGNED